METKLGNDNKGYRKYIFKYIGTKWNGIVEKIVVANPPQGSQFLYQTVTQKVTKDFLETGTTNSRRKTDP